MREIKFKAWDKINKIKVNVLSIKWEDGKISGLTIESLDGEPVVITKFGINDYVLLEYSGLKDKKGNEIYEYDVIKYTVPTGSGNLTKQVPVIFKNSRFEVPSSSLFAVHQICEVIGSKVPGYKPKCFTPEENAIYPLCVGNGSDDCLECCLFRDFRDSYYAELES